MDKTIMSRIYTAKDVFEVHGRNAAGEVVLRRRLKRSQKFFADHPKTSIGMERAARRITGAKGREGLPRLAADLRPAC